MVAGKNQQPLVLEFALPASDFHKEWKRCNMLANYIGEYAAYQFPQREKAENLISTIVNELLEAVTRLTPQESDFYIHCQQKGASFSLQTRHQIDASLFEPFHKFLESLRQENLDDMYMRLMVSAPAPETSFNQLGLVMLAHDFGVHLATRIDEKTDYLITTIDIDAEELQA